LRRDTRMRHDLSAVQRKSFCRAYLQTLNPDRAAEQAGCQDGWAMLRRKDIQAELQRMRDDSRDQILREDAVRRLTELAFGRANDAAALALSAPGQRPPVDKLDLSAVSELKVTDKGVEVKFLDRIRALEALCGLLDQDGDGGASFFRALEAAADDGEGL